MSSHEFDLTMSILKLNPDFVTKPLIRAYKDAEFLEKVNISLDPEYRTKIEQADLLSIRDWFQ